MDNYFNELEENIGKNNSTSGSLSLNVNGDTTDKEEKIFKILNNLDFSMNYGIDTKENITNIDISTNYYGDKLININTYIEDNNIDVCRHPEDIIKLPVKEEVYQGDMIRVKI